MSDFEEKLNAILGNADAMSQVMQLAQSLNLGGGSQEESDAPPPSPQSAESGPDLGSLGGLGNIGELLGQIDPRTIQRLLPLLGELTGGDEKKDQRAQLLYALRPFLKPERREKIDRALQAARLLHIGKKFLTTMGDPNV